MRVATARRFFFVAVAMAALSLTGGAIAKDIQGSGIVGSVTVVGHKVNCKPVTETQCTVDSHGGVHNCHEVSTTQCTIADISHGNPSPPFGGASAALSRPAFAIASISSGPSGIGSGSSASHFATPMARISTFRLR